MTSSRARDFAALFALMSSTIGGCVIERGSLTGESVDAFSPFDTASDVRIANDVPVPEDVPGDAGPDAHVIPSTELIAHWEFTTMTDLLRDSSGNGHTLTVLGAVSPGARSSSMELEFRSSPGLSTPNAPDFEGAVAVSLWARPALAPNAGQTFPLVESTNRLSVRYSAPVDNSGIPRTFECVHGTARVVSDDTLAGEWVHVACVEDGGRLSIYINGVSVRNSAVEAEMPSSSGYFLGAAPDGMSSAFVTSGRMDDVRIWGIAPSAEVITQLFMTTRP